MKKILVFLMLTLSIITYAQKMSTVQPEFDRSTSKFLCIDGNSWSAWSQYEKEVYIYGMFTAFDVISLLFNNYQNDPNGEEGWFEYCRWMQKLCNQNITVNGVIALVDSYCRKPLYRDLPVWTIIMRNAGNFGDEGFPSN